ncbi:MAG: SMC-Scp complex subunit ScpB [Planctomycetales bacterium 4572_13]|nr:MAG: SMC-Scp complex subunit ScpB [Planctomycetales bacterium 4572_13]
MTPDEKIDIEQPEVAETPDTAAETEVTDNTDWDETTTADAETAAKPVTESKEEIEDGEDLAEEQEPEPEEIEATLETVIEAVLFASDEPISPKRLVDVAEAGSVKGVNACVRAMNKKYRDGGRSFRIEKISGGYQMMTLSAFNPWITKLIKVRSDNKLTPAGLESLAIVAYKQPIMRADIEAIRGVASGEILRNLMYKGMVKIVGRAEVIGRPMLYGTTKKFLDVFGLNTLKDLPKIEELKAPQ